MSRNNRRGIKKKAKWRLLEKIMQRTGKTKVLGDEKGHVVVTRKDESALKKLLRQVKNVNALKFGIRVR